MNKYKLFTNTVNLPEHFIENVKLKEYLYPNNTSFEITPQKKVKKKKRSINNSDNTNNNEVNISPIRLRSQPKKRKIYAGNINYITTINPLKNKDKNKVKNVIG